MEIIFLGTSCMVPTKERNHQAIFIAHKEEGILVDCGEGTQRQLKLADIKPSKISKILISHWHGDHVLGLPGLLQTLGASGYEGTLKIYGPKKTRESFSHMFRAFSFAPAFEYEITEIEKGTKIETKDLIIEARELEHGISCLGYSIKEKDKRRIRLPFAKKKGIPEGPLLGQLQDNKKITWRGEEISPEDATYVVKGKKVAIILDTALCKNAFLLSEDADILISEAVYGAELLEKAEEYKHMTAKNAAELASGAKAKQLILTHFSQRYKALEQIIEEAKTIFPETSAAHDLMKVRI